MNPIKNELSRSGRAATALVLGIGVAIGALSFRPARCALQPVPPPVPAPGARAVPSQAPARLLTEVYHPQIQGAQLSGDGTRMVTWSSDGSVKVWEVSRPEPQIIEVSDGPAAWSPQQATGEPDTFECGDRRTAWAPMSYDKGEEWLELSYEKPIAAHMVRIHETYTPGSVVRLELKDEQGQLITAVPVKDPTRAAPSFLEVAFKVAARPVKSVRVVVNTHGLSSWPEIDAVELVGQEGRSWAKSATASNYYH